MDTIDSTIVFHGFNDITSTRWGKRDLYHEKIKIITMGVVSKGTTCSVDGCDNIGSRSLNTTKVESAGLRIRVKSKRSVLCKEHYREYKKESKGDRDLERARWG